MARGPSHSVTDRYDIFDVSKEDAHLLFILFIVLEPATDSGGELLRLGAQNFRALVEYRPDGVVESLHWEGLVADAQAPEGHRYISSRAQPTGPDAPATSSSGPQPIFTWHDRVPAADTMVVAAPEGARVAVIHQTAHHPVGVLQWARPPTRIVLHDTVNGRVLADYGSRPGAHSWRS